MTRCVLLLNVTVLFLWGTLSDERTVCLSYILYWFLPAQSFSGPSPLELATVFYSLRFETSLFVASYDSQGHGGGIRPRLQRRGLLYKALADSIEDTPRHGSISRVQQSVALGTLLIDYIGNVFRLIRCYSMTIRCYDLSLRDLHNFHVFVTMEVPTPNTLQYKLNFIKGAIKLFNYMIF
jgi:hypothetical protein